MHTEHRRKYLDGNVVFKRRPHLTDLDFTADNNALTSKVIKCRIPEPNDAKASCVPDDLSRFKSPTVTNLNAICDGQVSMHDFHLHFDNFDHLRYLEFDGIKHLE